VRRKSQSDKVIRRRIHETQELCLSESELIKLAEGRLSSEARVAAGQHVERCSSCFALVAELGRGTRSCDPIAATQAVTPSHDWQPPTIFDEYRLVEAIGRGAAGQVWLAQDVQLERLVAIKFLTGATRLGARERFRLEARAVARLAHPNVVTAFRVGECDERPYLVSEYVSGRSLDKLAKPVDWKEALRIGIGLARGMAAAHTAGVLHRDIKPANAILARSGEVKLVDFGLAKLLGPAQLDTPVQEMLGRTGGAEGMPDDSPISLTASGAILGTPLYMAPEAWAGAATTRQMDVYSLGAVLYELCCGQTPHVAASFHELRQAVERSEPLPLAARVAGIDPRFAAAIMRCLCREPRERFASGAELSQALEQIVATSATPPAVVTRPRSRARVVALAALGGAAAFALGALLWPRSTPVPAPAPIVVREPASLPPLDTDDANDGFGAALATGDWNDDGYPDLAVGVPGESADPLAGCGAVDLFAGGPGGLVPWRHLTGLVGAGGFGAALTTLDWNGDGVDDLAVGAPGEAEGRGAVHLLAGGKAGLVASASLVAEGGEAGDHFGTTLAVGDLDHDGAADDLVVAAPFARKAEGRVYVFVSGESTRLEAALAPPARVTHFGSALAVGDHDADGDDDLVVAATDSVSGRPVPGHVFTFRNDAGGLVAWAPLDEKPRDVGHDTQDNSFGAALAIGDLDADGVSDVIVGAPTGRPGGRYYRFLGRRSGPPRLWDRQKQHGNDELGDLFGGTLLALDLDHLGGIDLLVAATHERPYSSTTPMAGEVYIVRDETVGQDENDLVENALATPADHDEFGAAVAAADVDLDGRLDLFVGAPGYDTIGQRDAGAVFQFERKDAVFLGRRFLHEEMKRHGE
jgi:serine/threonine protein kinase